MLYYLYKNNFGEISGFTSSSTPIYNKRYCQVSFDEYNKTRVSMGLAAIKPEPPDELTLLKAQLQAMTERNEFIEDVIAEMAMEVYKTV